MPYEIYKLIHVVGLMLLFLGIGGMLLVASSVRERGITRNTILHALGLFAMLLGGFGMMARLGVHWPWPGWLIAKLLVWLTIGALPVIVRRGVVSRGLAWPLAAGLGSIAAWLAINKPF